VRNGNIVDYLQTLSGKRAEKIALVHQMALGMEYLHSRDIIHGDFKVRCCDRLAGLCIDVQAANVLVNDVGNINICDFGLSHLKNDMKRKSKDSNDASGKGTMRWLSPERMKGGQLTWKCDVYSFGMVIYEVSSRIVDSVDMPGLYRGLDPTRPRRRYQIPQGHHAWNPTSST